MEASLEYTLRGLAWFEAWRKRHDLSTGLGAPPPATAAAAVAQHEAAAAVAQAVAAQESAMGAMAAQESGEEPKYITPPIRDKSLVF